MICKISIILLFISFYTLIDGKNLLIDDDDNGLEISNAKAQMFLRAMTDDDDDLFDKRENPIGKHCVKCKFKINPCCQPNICVKKFFWNECMEIKSVGK